MPVDPFAGRPLVTIDALIRAKVRDRQQRTARIAVLLDEVARNRTAFAAEGGDLDALLEERQRRLEAEQLDALTHEQQSPA